MAQVVFAPVAERDLDGIAAYIARDNPPAAARLIARIRRLASTIAEAPGLGRAREELRPGLRSFPIGSYLLFYRPSADGIEVARVLHAARDLDRIAETGEL